MANNDHSRTDDPDLDWNQVRETVLMLNLAMARMTHALRDGDKSIDSLSRSFTKMVGHSKFMQDTITEMNEDDTRNNLPDHSAAIRANYKCLKTCYREKVSEKLCRQQQNLLTTTILSCFKRQTIFLININTR
ncbi:MAG: hypothetical protein HKM22_01540 [Gammaproteobacteria bacterium]|nr:hypothetical protein [Gammaproteobacteria bacterium]